jgi:hypothetical protein
MLNIFILFVIESISEDKLQLQFATACLKLIEKLEFIFGSMENENLLKYIKKLDAQNHTLKKADVSLNPVMADSDKESLTNGISFVDNPINVHL